MIWSFCCCGRINRDAGNYIVLSLALSDLNRAKNLQNTWRKSRLSTTSNLIVIFIAVRLMRNIIYFKKRFRCDIENSFIWPESGFELRDHVSFKQSGDDYPVMFCPLLTVPHFQVARGLIVRIILSLKRSLVRF